ncbi:MAG TPA: hypothetical protein VHL98_04385 [Microvirga sp.]|jgi:hypothetical protein|nr:hypothetical protein [Microvirga sp.]
MTTPVEPDLGPPSSARPLALVEDVPNFEAVFGIPATHRLLAVRSRSRGGPVSGQYWEHEEYDASGARVGRYESFEEVTASGARRSGWRKFDPAGSLVATGGDLA